MCEYVSVEVWMFMEDVGANSKRSGDVVALMMEKTNAASFIAT